MEEPSFISDLPDPNSIEQLKELLTHAHRWKTEEFFKGIIIRDRIEKLRVDRINEITNG